MTQLHSIASLDYGDGRTCVCRICECGKHPCPGLKLPFTGCTTYRDEYVPKSAEQERSRKRRGQAAAPTHVGAEHFKTTKQEAAEALAGRAVDRPESFKPKQGLKTPLPFEGITTNRADFPGHIPDSSDRRKRQQEPMPKLKGMYDTTNGAMQNWAQRAMDDGSMPKPPKSFNADYGARKDVPFEGITSYTADYPIKKVPKPLPVSRNAAGDSVPEMRDFQTTSSSTYKIPPMHLNHTCPASYVPQRPPSRDGHVKLSVYNIPTGDTYVSS